MLRQEFIQALEYGLKDMPQDDVAERVTFYQEMIDDRMEDGLTEEEAIAELGAAADIASQILSERPLAQVETSRRPLRGWEIVLLVLGSPVWLPLLIALLAVALAAYAVVWSLIAALWAVEIALGASAVAGILCVLLFVFRGYWLSAAAGLGAALVCAGLSILGLRGCLSASRAILSLTKRVFTFRFAKKEAAK